MAGSNTSRFTSNTGTKWKSGISAVAVAETIRNDALS